MGRDRREGAEGKGQRGVAGRGKGVEREGQRGNGKRSVAGVVGNASETEHKLLLLHSMVTMCEDNTCGSCGRNRWHTT